MAGKPRRIPCAACGKKFEQKDKRRKYCSKVCSGKKATPRGEDSPLFKAGQFTAEARAKRKKQRAKWRAIAKAVRAGKIDALEIARMEYADALDRWKELHELSEHKPDLLVDRALASAATEKRLSGRHVNEAEASRHDPEAEDHKQEITVRFYPASPTTGATETDTE